LAFVLLLDVSVLLLSSDIADGSRTSAPRSP
jgi:hypothetical protein